MYRYYLGVLINALSKWDIYINKHGKFIFVYKSQKY